MSNKLDITWDEPATLESPIRENRRKRRCDEDWKPYDQILVELRLKGATAEQIRHILEDEYGFSVNIWPLKKRLQQQQRKNKSHKERYLAPHMPRLGVVARSYSQILTSNQHSSMSILNLGVNHCQIVKAPCPLVETEEVPYVEPFKPLSETRPVGITPRVRNTDEMHQFTDISEVVGPLRASGGDDPEQLLSGTGAEDAEEHADDPIPLFEQEFEKDLVIAMFILKLTSEDDTEDSKDSIIEICDPSGENNQSNLLEIAEQLVQRMAWKSESLVVDDSVLAEATQAEPLRTSSSGNTTASVGDDHSPITGTFQEQNVAINYFPAPVDPNDDPAVVLYLMLVVETTQSWWNREDIHESDQIRSAIFAFALTLNGRSRHEFTTAASYFETAMDLQASRDYQAAAQKTKEGLALLEIFGEEQLPVLLHAHFLYNHGTALFATDRYLEAREFLERTMNLHATRSANEYTTLLLSLAVHAQFWAAICDDRLGSSSSYTEKLLGVIGSLHSPHSHLDSIKRLCALCRLLRIKKSDEDRGSDLYGPVPRKLADVVARCPYIDQDSDEALTVLGDLAEDYVSRSEHENALALQLSIYRVHQRQKCIQAVLDIMSIGQTLDNMGHKNESIQAFTYAYRKMRQWRGENDFFCFKILQRLAFIFTDVSRHVSALRLLERVQIGVETLGGMGFEDAHYRSYKAVLGEHITATIEDRGLVLYTQPSEMPAGGSGSRRKSDSATDV